MQRIVERIHGTWGSYNKHFAFDSPLMRDFTVRGWTVSRDAYEWSGRLNIPIPDDDPDTSIDDAGRRIWVIAAENFGKHCKAVHGTNNLDTIIAHSHGGQVAVFALYLGYVTARYLITHSTPVRSDMQSFRAAITSNLNAWIHIHGDRWKDIMGSLGTYNIGQLPSWVGRLFARDPLSMPEATYNIHAVGYGHTEHISHDVYWKHRIWPLIGSEQ